MFMDENKKGINQEVKEELKDILEQSEDKSEAILRVADRIAKIGRASCRERV